MLKAIFATDLNGGFGYKGRMPWPKIKQDMQHFVKVTSNGAIVMGRLTWESLPTLPYRLPIVVSDHDIEHDGIIRIPRKAMKYIDKFGNYARYASGKDVTIIGGTSLLVPEYLKHCQEIHHTTVKGTFEADTFISKDTLEFLKTLESEVILDDNKVTIRRYYAAVSKPDKEG